MTEPIKPCPFCGAPPRKVEGVMGEWTKAGGYSPSGVRFSCSSPAEVCVAMGVPAYGDDMEAQAARNWNRRAPTTHI